MLKKGDVIEVDNVAYVNEYVMQNGGWLRFEFESPFFKVDCNQDNPHYVSAVHMETNRPVSILPVKYILNLVN